MLPLPPRPNLKQYKKRAKDLVTAAKSKDQGAIRAWATEWLETLVKLLGITFTPFIQGSLDGVVGEIEARVRETMTTPHAKGGRFTLADAQFFIARAHGFENWSEFANHLERLFREDPEGREFEAAVDAVVTGDLSTLESLVRRHPDLIRARSARTHRATLLHYVAANGVEGYRQRTPPNAVAVARFLLEAGAEVDALGNTYGGDKYQTTMNLLVSSTHPAEAGLQPALVEVLLDFGAAINGLEEDESPLMTALAFGYSEAAETLARRGARVDNVIAAAALGRSDMVRSFVIDKATLRSDVPLIAPYWMGIPNDPKAHIELAFVWACKFGRAQVVDFFLEMGVDPTAKDSVGMTALHWAAANGLMDVIDKLLERGAPLEVENTWGGTVLDSTVYSALNHHVDGADYLAVIETLISAGADVGAVTPFPTGNQHIDDLLRRHGARPG